MKTFSINITDESTGVCLGTIIESSVKKNKYLFVTANASSLSFRCSSLEKIVEVMRRLEGNDE